MGSIVSGIKLDRCAALPGISGAAALFGLCADSLPPSSGQPPSKSLPASDSESFRNRLRVTTHARTCHADLDLLLATLAEDSG
jgi:hypothetical protein